MLTQKNNSRILAKTGIGLLVLGVVGAGIFLAVRDSEAPVVEDIEPIVQTQTQPVLEDVIPEDFAAPPTDEEQAAGNEQKDTIDQENENPPILQNTASVAIVDASQYDDVVEVRAFVTNIVADGTCEIMFTNGAETVGRSVDALADASTTPCVNISVPRSEFSTAGEWTVTVTYKNDTVQGSTQETLQIE